MKKNTYKELAIKANVSRSVLSRFFNNGYVSKEKKEAIKKAINETGYIKNRNASSIRLKEKKGTIIIRTFVFSRTQDHIINGIIFASKDEETIVKYSSHFSEGIIKNIMWALSLDIKNLIIFAPINPTKKFIKWIEIASKYCNISIYNYKQKNVYSIIPSNENFYKEISKKIKTIEFIYENKKDINSYKNKIKNLKKYFKNVVLTHKSNANQNDNYKIYEYDNLRIKLNEKKYLKNNIIFSYEKPILKRKKDIWVFIDNFQIGIYLWKKITNKNENNVIHSLNTNKKI